MSPCVHVAGAVVMVGGPVREITDLEGGVWRFEAHEHFGPAVIGKRGEILSAQPGSRSPFWPAVNAWYQQGRRLNAEGRCLYDLPPPELPLLHLGGRNYCDDTPENRVKFARYLQAAASRPGGEP